jgi:zona occludens toxin
MIRLFTGTPGSGKSLHTALIIWTRLKHGRRVIANFPINKEPIKETKLYYYLSKLGIKIKNKDKKLGDFTYWDMSEINVNKLVQYAKNNHKMGRENQTLLIIDECSVIFNSRAWDAKDRMKWIVFFQQHRKLGYNVILIAQNDRMIDRQIRGFVEYEVKHRCVNNYKLFGQLLGLITGGKLFIANTYWYGMREKIESEYFRLNRRIAKIYDTFEIFESAPVSGVGKPSEARRGPATDARAEKLITEVIT